MVIFWNFFITVLYFVVNCSILPWIRCITLTDLWISSWLGYRRQSHQWSVPREKLIGQAWEGMMLRCDSSPNNLRYAWIKLIIGVVLNYHCLVCRNTTLKDSKSDGVLISSPFLCYYLLMLRNFMLSKLAVETTEATNRLMLCLSLSLIVLDIIIMFCKF